MKKKLKKKKGYSKKKKKIHILITFKNEWQRRNTRIQGVKGQKKKRLFQSYSRSRSYRYN